MELSKKFLLTVSLVISLAGLVLIYAASLNTAPQKIPIGDITSDMEGRTVTITGHISQKRDTTDGHLFLTLSDKKNDVQVPIFSDLMKSMEKIGVTKSDFRINSTISVQGTVGIYKGSLQILPKKVTDVKILGD